MTLEKLQARINQLVEEKKRRGLPIDGELVIRLKTPYYNRSKSQFLPFNFVEGGTMIVGDRQFEATISVSIEDEVK